jgi:aryl-alcohol dehydrogenase-like predicted oxidoreductase
VGILAHSVLGKGLLTGKYKRGHVFPEDDERSGFFDFQGERFNQYCDAVEKLSAIAERKGHTMTELAVGWVLREPAVSVALVGAKSETQVLANCKFVESFTAEELSEIEAILEGAPHLNWTITNGGNEAGGGGANWKPGMPEF